MDKKWILPEKQGFRKANPNKKENGNGILQHTTNILPKLRLYPRLKIFANFAALARWDVHVSRNFGNMPNVVCYSRTKKNEARIL
jgi:hypothetical protein